MTYLEQNDVVTFLESGTVEFKPGKMPGNKPHSRQVSEGEVFCADAVWQIEGAEHQVNRAELSRVQNKRAPRPQTPRFCSLSFASLEMPDTVDPQLRDIENRLQLRSDARQRRLRQEADALKAN